MKNKLSILERLRKLYHEEIFSKVLYVDENGIPNNADESSKLSKKIALGIVERIASELNSLPIISQTSGKQFELVTLKYLENSLKEVKDFITHEYSIDTQKRFHFLNNMNT